MDDEYANRYVGGDGDGNGDPSLIAQCIALLRSKKIKLVAFDMDQTAVAMHSMGRLRRDDLESYLSKATEDFITLFKSLYDEGFFLAIATHSDEAEFGLFVRPQTHILGKELVQKLLEYHFAPELVSSVHIVAYNPRVRKYGRDPANIIKRYHMRELQNRFSVQPNETVFFDDTSEVVIDCAENVGVWALKVDPKVGFQMSNILLQLN